jgi:hypothetical protein
MIEVLMKLRFCPGLIEVVGFKSGLLPLPFRISPLHITLAHWFKYDRILRLQATLIRLNNRVFIGEYTLQHLATVF